MTDKNGKTLKVALIGIGGMGYCHYCCYDNIKDAEIVAVCDVREDMAKGKILSRATSLKEAGKIAKDAPLPRVYGDLETLLATEKIDVADICTPTYLHAEMAIKCLEKGVHVLCEKPMTLTAREAETVLAAAEKSGKKFMAAHVVRFMSPYVYLRKTIESGKYGKLQRLDMKRLSSIPTWSWEDWMRCEEKSGGVGLDLSVHDLDFVFSVLGEPQQKSAVFRPVKNNSSFIASTLLYGEESKFAGACVTCEASWYNADIPFCAEFFAVFDNGYLRLQGGVLTDNGKTVTFDSAAKKQDLGINVSGDDAYAEEIAYFLSCVKNDMPITYVTPESALQTVRLTRELIKNAVV